MVRATWNDTLIAESDDTVVVEGTHYFRQEDVSSDHLQPSDTQTVCHWKGIASYYSVVVGDDVAPGWLGVWLATHPSTRQASACLRAVTDALMRLVRPPDV